MVKILCEEQDCNRVTTRVTHSTLKANMRLGMRCPTSCKKSVVSQFAHCKVKSQVCFDTKPCKDPNTGMMDNFSDQSWHSEACLQHTQILRILAKQISYKKCKRKLPQLS
ncbi:hypothetical protein XENORESO_005582 [Xenotaenia resolanae]|uniref:Uncharacterized protein n=1 Tax=Xenotaenia resolanae TaxID=208358 RepID=A0ABV0VY89_9TELE